MTTQNLTIAVQVDQPPEKVFTAINNIKGWWSEDVDGITDQLGQELVYRDKHLWCRMKITELTLNKKVVWHVLESEMDNFKGGSEWDNTDLTFEITKKNDTTEILFTHVGLVPGLGCYTVCSRAWTFYVTSSLTRLITTGKGEPIKKG